MIALLQRLQGPKRMRALLVRTSSALGEAWQTEGWASPERQAWHKRKMESKLTRPAAQLALLGLDLEEGQVLHVDLAW